MRKGIGSILGFPGKNKNRVAEKGNDSRFNIHATSLMSNELIEISHREISPHCNIKVSDLFYS
jgi:hypothetical protein